MTHHDKTILVTGATGKQGGATARRLLADGWRVRALVRDPGAAAAAALAEAGTDLVTGDLDDPRTLNAAVHGVHGVFAVPPAAFGPQGWDMELELRRGKNLVDAAVAAEATHIVFTGIAAAANAGEPREIPRTEGKRHIEEHIKAAGLRYTLLRPARFMENYLVRGVPVDGINSGVHRHLFRPDLPMPIIAVGDIAVFAALVFADPDRFDGRALGLAGDAPTPVEAAAAISAATGLDIGYRRMDRAEAAALGDEIADTWDCFDAGDVWQADIPALRVLHPGLATLEGWLSHVGAEGIKALPRG